MPKGISLHIGLNKVDPAHYQDGDGRPWDGALKACEADARDMDALAKKRGFTTRRLLLTAAATTDAVIAAIGEAAAKLAKGDLFLLTYSGHGGQMPDLNHDEDVLPTGQKDRMDETWVLFDRQLVDDELYTLWARFKAGVRILVLSDSCHSGTVVRNIPPSLMGLPAGTRFRRMPVPVAERTFAAHRKLYADVQKANPTAEKSVVKASVLLISGCQDNQYSMDGDRNGLFTGTLKRVWRDGRFKGAHRTFRDCIVAEMPDTQTPNYYVVGKPNLAFEAQRPFAI
jgi:metacaspase-1